MLTESRSWRRTPAKTHGKCDNRVRHSAIPRNRLASEKLGEGVGGSVRVGDGRMGVGWCGPGRPAPQPGLIQAAVAASRASLGLPAPLGLVCHRRYPCGRWMGIGAAALGASRPMGMAAGWDRVRCRAQWPQGLPGHVEGRASAPGYCAPFAVGNGPLTFCGGRFENGPKL